MKILILAAGQGDRLEHMTDTFPKAMVKVCKTELLRYQQSFIDHPAVTAVGLVVGYQGKTLKKFVARIAPHIEIFENPHFTKGSILSLKAAFSFLDNDFFLMNVDHIYPKRMFPEILKKVKGITAVCDFDRRLVEDDMKIRQNEKEHLTAIHKQLTTYDGGYIGMTYCPKARIARYKKAVAETIKIEGNHAAVERVLGRLAKEGEIVHIADTSGIGWLEVDTIQDLKSAEITLKHHPDYLR